MITSIKPFCLIAPRAAAETMRTIILCLCLPLIVGCDTLIPLKVSPPAEVAIEYTPERIARGEYIARHVTACTHCHSGLDWDYFAGGIPKAGTGGAGGYHFTESLGLIGSYDLYARNITPSALGEWTDGELIRAIVEGISRDGKPLFPIMPYARYRHMDQEDLYSIVAYIRSLEPIPNPLPNKRLKRLFKYIERTFPKPYDPQLRPDPSNRVAYGEYLTTIGDCVFCHTTMTITRKPIAGMAWAGGNSFPLPRGGKVYSANISPDPETGIGDWLEDDFIELFKSYSEPFKLPASKQHENTVMPWVAFSGMTEEDLGAIYEYLMSVEPVSNNVERWPAED